MEGGTISAVAHPDLAALEQRGWAYSSPTFRALGHAFAVRADDPIAGTCITRVLAPFATSGTPSAHYSLIDAGPGQVPRYALYWQEELIARITALGRVLAMLQWHINRQVITGTPEVVSVHAACAERDGVGVALPGAMESGKSTLVAGLVRTGFRYLTDEAMVIDPATLLVRPYPKPLSLDRGSWTLFPELEPTIDLGFVSDTGAQWQVPATDIHPDALAPPVGIGLVIAPTYRRGAATALEPVSRADMLLTLMECTFGLHQHGRAHLETLARVVRGAACYRLTIGALDETCALINRLVQRTTTGLG